MEALAAISLAGNIVQFVGFFRELLSKSFEIHSSATGCTDSVSTLDTVYDKLSAFISKLPSCSHSISVGSTQLDENVAAIEELSKSCKADCEKLLEIVRKLKSDNGSKGTWRSFRKALKALWERERIDELEKRLRGTQATLTLLICTIISQWQSVHEKELENLKTESKQLHSEHSEKLNQIKHSLNEIESLIRAAKSSSPNGNFLVTGVSMLEKKMAQLDLTKETIAKDQSILKSLSYSIRPARHASICEAHEETFNWIFERPNDGATHEMKLLDWLEGGNGIFWISGKPGSGKSTLIKFVADSIATRRALESWSAPKPAVIASHYFWSAGTEMQKSQKGLLQSLLYDIFRQFPDLIELTCGTRWSRTAKSDSMYWSLSELHYTLQEVASSENLTSKLCFFIDGLDEYAGDHLDICQTLKGLAKSPHIKLCVSSRPLNAFKEAFEQNPWTTLYIHELTKGDIQRFAQSRLQEHPRWNGAINASQRQSLVEEVSERASGVFLWVFLVTRELRESLTIRDPFPDLLRRLESIPTELEPFFRQILESVDVFYHDRMSTTLQIALAAKKPLHISIYAFHYLEKEDPDYALHVPIREFTVEETKEMEENTAWHLNSRTRGLLEVHVASRNVDFLHRTVVDFLRTREMSDFLAAKTSTNFNPTISILKAYTASIKSTPFPLSLCRVGPGDYCSGLTQLLQDALSYATEMERQRRHGEKYTHKLLYELEISLPQIYNQRSNLATFGMPVLDVFREHLVCASLVNYLHAQLMSYPGCLKFLGKSLLDFLIYDTSNADVRMREGRTEMVRYALETENLDLNEILDHTTGETTWTYFIAMLCQSITSATYWNWDNLDSSLLRLFLHYGASANDSMPWTMPFPGAYTSFCSASSIVWVNYLRISFWIPPKILSRYESAYLDVLDEFFNHGADLKAVTRPLERAPSKGRTTSLDVFLDEFYGIAHRANFEILAKIICKLFDRAEEADLELPIEGIRRVMGKVSSPHLRSELENRVLEQEKRMKDSRRGEKRGLRDMLGSEHAPRDRKEDRKKTRRWFALAIRVTGR